MKFFKRYLVKMYSSAMDLNDKNVCKALEYCGPQENLLDVGCRDGEKTQSYIHAAKSTNNFGIELIESAAVKANQKGIKTVSCYADRDVWPFEDNFFDVVVSNQVIEHLSDVDHFIGEAYRVLKPGGHLITSTNNLSSRHNIIALLFGWAPFDLTNCSKRVSGIGNPLAIHQGETAEYGDSWTHKCIYTVYRLNSRFSKFGFKSIKDYGSGYYPLGSYVGSLIKKHCAFITLINIK